MVNSQVIYQLKWCWRISKGYVPQLVIYYLAELIVIACSLAFIVFSKQAIDYAVNGNKSLMLTSIYWTVALILLNLLFKTISIRFSELSKVNLLRDLQDQIINAQMFSTWEFIKSWNTGDVQLRIHRDCTEIVQMITQVFPNFTLTLIRLGASLSLLWFLDSRLAFLILILTPLFLFSKIYYKQFRELNKDLKHSESNLGHVVNESLKFRMLIKTLGIENQRRDVLNKVQEKIVRLKIKILNFSIVSQTIVKVTLNIGFLVTFIWSVFGLHAGTITFGTMTAFLQLVGRVQNPMLGLLGFFPSFISFGVSVERIQELMENRSEEDLNQEKIERIDKLEITALNFRYDDKNVLENVNLVLRKGHSTAILGTSGRGKTTLIRLLLSVIKPQSGEIKLYSGDVIDFVGPKYRTNFSYVPQGDKLFSTSIKENILLGMSDVSEEKLRSVIYHSCSEFIYDLPNGLNTIVGESGYGLSEGQAQRIAIARVLLRETSVWLFDEITSSLDSQTSKLLIERLHHLGSDKILVFVTHDIELAEYCDQIYYMK